ncbi:MAG: hypothetical protein JW967_08120 [Dehalococcoidales bacterium]|nr:hypothetical protein [Dehalococcoidales bacterium]
MNRMTVLLGKDLKDIIKSRITYSYIIVPLFLSFAYVGMALNSMNSLEAAGIGKEIMTEAAQATINGIFNTLPLVVIMLVCSVLASYAVVLDKTKRITETLLATPLSLRQIWIAKSLAITIPSAVIGILISLIMLTVVNYIAFVPRVGFIFPGPLSLATGILLVPFVSFFVVSIVTCLQLIMTNPRLASLVFSVLFLAVFFSTALSQTGLRLDFSLIYLVLVVILLAINFFLARLLTKERIVLSSKT